MKTVMLMFDSLNRAMLPCYGGSEVIAPNFERLARKTATFDNCYMGSMPCMPARRELHTGRYNFLHRIWGPLEPFDDSMPEMLSKHGVYTHLVTDHFHYFEDGGLCYVNRYDSWEFARGQEGDPWKGEVRDPVVPECIRGREEIGLWRHDFVNRKYLQSEEDQPLTNTFERGFEFIEKNKDEDNWFLQIENFTPHEPFYVLDKYLKQYGDFSGLTHFDWPPYATVQESEEDVRHLRAQYMALVTMCDEYLGKLLDMFDKYDMWKDTMLIVNVDHGILLGEHGRYGKRVCRNYNEIANIPLFIYDPRSKVCGERRSSLVQTIDIAPTILEFFGVERTPDMQGVPLKNTVATDEKVRDYALFGLFGEDVNITDGRYVYMRAPRFPYGEKCFNYTLMPTYMSSRFSVGDFADATYVDGFSFTKGMKVLKIKPRALPKRSFLEYEELSDALYDLANDQKQLSPITAPETAARLAAAMKNEMRKNDAPAEQYERLGL